MDNARLRPKETNTTELGPRSAQASVTSSIPDIRAMMERIRSQVKAEVDSSGAVPGSSKFSSNTSEQLSSSEELRYLNHQFAFAAKSAPGSITTHRRGPIAWLVVTVKRKVQKILWESLLSDYFQREKEFNTHLVRLLNQVCREVDGNSTTELKRSLKELRGLVEREAESKSKSGLRDEQ